MVERIDLSLADDPRDVVHRAVACLAQGGVVGLPTESTYGIAAGALNPLAVERLKKLAGGPPTLWLRGADEVRDWATIDSELAHRLTHRVWPGPVTLGLPSVLNGLTSRLDPGVQSYLAPENRVALRIPADRMVREILRLMPGPLIEVNPPGGQFATSADSFDGLADLDMILDDGPTRLGGPSTLVTVQEGQWSITRPGVVSDRTIAQMAGTILLFICTGNTCRSPMAEALCKTMLARRLDCETRELVDRGFVVLSAGVSAMDGMPAAKNAIEVVRARGGSLSDHLSRRASPDLVRHADHILVMTLDHLDILLDQVPEVGEIARLLDPDGDIDDPVGYDLDTYQRTALEIERNLAVFLDQQGYR